MATPIILFALGGLLVRNQIGNDIPAETQEILKRCAEVL
jgi:hypothetical protein